MVPDDLGGLRIVPMRAALSLAVGMATAQIPTAEACQENALMG
jgi:hypothetical protein